MSEEKKLDPVEAIQKKRTELRAASVEASKAQEAIDLEALLDAEVAHGYGSVRSLKVPGYVKGLPTMAIVRSPEKRYHKRYTEMVRRANGDLNKIAEALDMLGTTCLVYPPEGELREAFAESFPSFLSSCGLAAVELATLAGADEKKG